MSTNANFNLEQLGCRAGITQRFYQLTLTRNLHEFSTYEVHSEANIEAIIKAISPIKESYAHLPLDAHKRNQSQIRIFDLEDTLILVSVWDQNYTITGTGEEREKLDKVMLTIREALPPTKPSDPNTVLVNFWSLAPNGAAQQRTRRIAVPSWEKVELNYTRKTRKDITSLIKLQPPIEDAGNLMLWHGIPGTGKSYGIRALAQVWQKWCDIHYVVDPERFFGEADYMLQVILQNAESGESPTPATEDKDAYIGPRWNLLIMEDSDEFLALDAKTRQGQAMARLLNLTSGFIGQGLRVLVLITTNELLDNIHKALQREGRCMASIEFAKLEPPEVQEWIKAHDIPAKQIPDNGHRTVAELYNLTRKSAQIRPVKQPLGFLGKPTS